MSKEDRFLPSYEESEYGSASQSTPQGQRIIDQLNAVRSQHVRSAIERVYPVVEENASRGIAKTVIVLLPSDVVSPKTEKSPFDDEPRDQKVEVDMSFSTDEDVRQIQLQGDMNRDFWKQAGVVDDLQTKLQQRLSSNPEFQSLPTPTSPPVADLPKAAPKSRSIFSRMYSKSAVKDVVWDAPKAVDRPPQVKEKVEVRVNIEEICLRTVSDFGLYETITRQGVIVRVHVRL